MTRGIAGVGMGLGLALLLGCPPEEPAKKVTLGAVNPATGALAPYGPALENGVQLAVAEINAAGGVLEGTLEVRFEDSQTDATASGNAAQRLIDLGVPAIIGAAGSGNSIAVSQKTIPAKVVQISGASTSPALTGLDDDGYVFRTVPSDAFQGVVLASEIYTVGGHTSTNVLYVDNAYGQGLKDVFEGAYTALGGSVAVTRAYRENPGTSYDFQGALDAVFAGPPAAVLLIAYAEDGTSFLSTWSASGGFSGAWYLTDGLKSADVAANVGASVVEGIEGTAPASPSGSGYDAFKTAYVAKYGEDPGIFAENYYDATMLLGLALAKAGKADGTAIRDALSAVANPPGTKIGVGEFQKGLDELAAGNDIDYDGASGPVDFDAAGDVSGPVEVWRFTSGVPTQVKIVDP